jgi:hypothetical protein
MGSDKNKRRHRKTRSNVAPLPHGKEEGEIPRIQHDLFLSAADHESADTSTAWTSSSVSPRVPKGFSAPGAAALHVPHQSLQNRNKKQRKEAPQPVPPLPPPPPPSLPPPAAMMIPHHSSLLQTGAVTTTTTQHQERGPPAPAASVAVASGAICKSGKIKNESDNKNDQKKAAIASPNRNTTSTSSSASTTTADRRHRHQHHKRVASPKKEAPPPPLPAAPLTAAEAKLIRRTQKLCNAWARSPTGQLTFTELLLQDIDDDDQDDDDEEKQMQDESSSPPPLLRPDQLPHRLRLSLNADVFERTTFRLTNTGTFAQVLTMSDQEEEQQEQQEEEESLDGSEQDAEVKPSPAAPPPPPMRKDPPTTSAPRIVAPASIKTEGTAVNVPPKNTNADDDDTFAWFEGSIPIHLSEDAASLNTVQQLIRQNMEYFSAVEGNNRKGIVRGRVGIRCRYCFRCHIDTPPPHGIPIIHRTDEWECYPSSYDRLHNAITKKFLYHFQQCPNLPAKQRSLFRVALRDEENLRKLGRHHYDMGKGGGNSSSSMPNSVYTRLAAHRVGIVHFAHDGLRFERDLALPALSMETVQIADEQQTNAVEPTPVNDGTANVDSTTVASFVAGALGGEGSDTDDNSFAKASDKVRCTDYFFLSIRHAMLCHANEADVQSRLRRQKKGRLPITVGVAGMCCRWCHAKRIFPAYEDGMTAAILGNLSTHFMTTCPLIPAEQKAAFHLHKTFHAQQHTSIHKSLRDDMVQDLWLRLRSHDRCRIADGGANGLLADQNDVRSPDSQGSASYHD